MKTTCDYLDALRAQLGISSDYKLAKSLGVSHGCISNYRTGRATFDERIAFQVADLLTLPKSRIWLDIHAERAAKSGNNAVLEILRELGGLAA